MSPACTGRPMRRSPRAKSDEATNQATRAS
jgi:hypothetical protein